MSFLSRLPVAVKVLLICGALGTFINFILVFKIGNNESRDQKRTEKLSDSEQTQQRLEDKGKCYKNPPVLWVYAKKVCQKSSLF